MTYTAISPYGVSKMPPSVATVEALVLYNGAIEVRRLRWANSLWWDGSDYITGDQRVIGWRPIGQSIADEGLCDGEDGENKQAEENCRAASNVS